MNTELERKKVPINRRTWNTGERYAQPQLVTEMNDRHELCHCCLAFLGMACEIKEEDMVDVALPDDILMYNWPNKLLEASGYKSDEEQRYYDRWDQALAAINDADGVDDETREAWIDTGFEILFGFDVEFTGQYGEDQTPRSDYDEDYWDEGDDGDDGGGYGC